MTGKVQLDRSPPPESFIDGMALGSSVNAITGEMPASALEPSSVGSKDIVPSDASDTFRSRYIDNVRDLSDSFELGLNASITFPVDGLTVGVNRGIDFSQNTQSSGRSLLVMLYWERHGPSKRIGDNAKLNGAAANLLKSNPAGFRDSYGDYYVYEIAYAASFVALWKCTAESSSSIKKFKQTLEASASIPGTAGGLATFQNAIGSAASSNHVSLDVQYDAKGATGNVTYDPSDVYSTFQAFQKSNNPVPTTVYFRHYSVIDPTVPNTINMGAPVYERLCKVFSDARFILMINGIAPGTAATRLKRKTKIAQLFKTIHSKRIAFQKDATVLKKSIASLDKLRAKLLLLLDRQDLVTDLRGLTFDDLRQGLVIDHDETWVKSANGTSVYRLGRTTFTDKEKTKYAIQYVTGMEAHLDGIFLQQREASIAFPGSLNAIGIVVGIEVQAKWTDGTDGFWCIPRDNPLGTKSFSIAVKSEGSRGMHWGLGVYYIPSADYGG